MSTKDAKIATFLAAALAIGVLVRAPFVSTAAMYAQVSDSSRRNGTESGITLVVDKIRHETVDLVNEQLTITISAEKLQCRRQWCASLMNQTKAPPREGAQKIAATSEVESLQQQIQDLQDQIFQLNAIIDSLTPSGSNNQTTPTSPTKNSTG